MIWWTVKKLIRWSIRLGILFWPISLAVGVYLYLR